MTNIMACFHKTVFAYVFLTVFFFTMEHSKCQEVRMRYLHYDIEEEQGAGVLVANVGRDSGLFFEFKDRLEVLSFSPFTVGNPNSKYFTVDKETGDVKTAQNIDRERVCQKQVECYVNLDVAVYKHGAELLMFIRLDILIKDINDNAPIFPTRIVTLSFPENTPINQTGYTCVATDADSEGPNSEIVHRFQSTTTEFELSIMKLKSGHEDLVITTKKVLDREAKEEYSLVVVASDLADKPLSGSVLINIVVTDMNDHAPEFAQHNYTRSVLENWDINDPVMIVSASDNDVNENARLTYSFSPQVSSDIKETFTVDPSTGKIYARKNLDYETRDLYQFHVAVTDQGSPPKGDTTFVTIVVTGVNDNAPTVRVIVPPGGGHIMENNQVGNFVAHVRVEDKDSGPNGEVSCRINDPHFVLEEFDGPSPDIYFYKVKLGRALDREDSPVRNVEVICEDHGSGPLTGKGSFRVTVGDENDNSPVFDESTLYGTVLENGDDNAVVMRVLANDPDDGENKRVSYSIALRDRDSSLFRIDPDDGTITTTSSLDRELKAEYFLLVTATDHGVPRRSATATATVKVLDENDYPPKFTKQSFNASIDENMPIGTKFGEITAYDSDTKAHGLMEFSIIRSGPFAENARYFRIEKLTGVLQSNATFDREQKSVYRFTVKVSDPTTSNYFDTANVTVTIRDQNDHAPIITSPPADQRQFVCFFNTSVDEVIVSFEAEDRDDPEHVDITFSIPSSARTGRVFDMDVSGKLRLARQIEPEDVTSYILDVVVADGSLPSSRSTTVTVTIVVAAGTPEEMRRTSEDIGVGIYLLIGGIIAVAIAILACDFIFTICLIRCVGKKRQQPQPARSPTQNGVQPARSPTQNGVQPAGSLTQNRVQPAGSPTQNGVDSNMNHAAQGASNVSVANERAPESNDTHTREVPGTEKKKKEVSFSPDYEDVESPFTSDSMGSVYTPPPIFLSKQKSDNALKPAPPKESFIVMNEMTIPDFSEHLYIDILPPMDASDEHPLMEVNRQGEDSYTDASLGDTVTSDSGRGRSEDEGHGHSTSSGHGDKRKFRTRIFKNSGFGSKLNNNDTKRVSSSSSSHNIHPCQHQVMTEEPEEIPVSPTPMLSEQERSPQPHCYIRLSFDTLPTHGLGYPSGSNTANISSTAQSSPAPRHNDFNTQPQTCSHSAARQTLSQNECEDPYHVKKAEQHQLQTFSSPYATGLPSGDTHPAWRRAKGLDTSWTTSRAEDDDNTTTSGSYTINTDDLEGELYILETKV